MATSWYPNSNNCCQIWVSKRIQNSLEMCILSLFDLKNAGNWPFQNPLKIIILRILLDKIEILIKLTHFKAYCREFTPCKRSFRFWSRICSKYLFLSFLRLFLGYLYGNRCCYWGTTMLPLSKYAIQRPKLIIISTW